MSLHSFGLGRLYSSTSCCMPIHNHVTKSLSVVKLTTNLKYHATTKQAGITSKEMNILQKWYTELNKYELNSINNTLSS